MIIAAVKLAITFLPIFLLVAVAIIVASIKGSKTRSEELQRVASELGLSFEIEPCDAARNAAGESHLMNRGRRKRYRNLVTAETDDVRIQIFDYRYKTGSGKNSTTHHQTVTLLSSPATQMPSFHARPENIFDAVGSALGFQDIDFDDHPEFSNAFILKSDAEDQTRRFFDRELLDFFAAKPGVIFEGSPGVFLFHVHRYIVKPDDLKGLLGDAYTIFDALRDRSQRA